MAKNNPTPETGLSLKDKLSKIQIEFKANKSRFNSFGNYNFRSAEDILEALKPMNEKYNVFFTVQESFKETNLNIPILVSTAMIVDCEMNDENTPAITASAVVGVDLGQKGMQTPQAFGSASSYAKKYALGNLLLIDDKKELNKFIIRFYVYILIWVKIFHFFLIFHFSVTHPLKKVKNLGIFKNLKL
jgi:hypothetical protein